MTDEQQIFLSESSVYRILKARGLIIAQAHIFLSSVDEFKDKTGFVHQMCKLILPILKFCVGVGII
jgi:hypothetical protein